MSFDPCFELRQLLEGLGEMMLQRQAGCRCRSSTRSRKINANAAKTTIESESTGY
jgi:hypothetical protein